MVHNTKVFLFGDQTYDFVPKLRELLPIKDNPILTAFFEQAHFVVRAQMIQLLTPQEHKAARTSDLAHLLQKYVDGGLNPAFQTALSCICQLGCFIREYDDVGKPYPRSDDSYVLGLCTGALAAAAVSSSNSLSELLPIAVQTVLISFRLGLCVLGMRDRLELSEKVRAECWSVVISDLEPQDAATAIKDFCKTNCLSKIKHPWITATAPKSTTISGTPRILARLTNAPFFSSLKKRNIPIYVPAHNPQLFTSRDVKSILETTSETTWTGYPVQIPFLSSVTGKLAWVRNYRALMELAVSQCLLDPIAWDNVEAELPRLLKARGADNINILPFTTSAQKALSSTLNSNGLFAEIGKGPVDSAKYSHRPGSGKCKLAIVSMSGRFPESQSTDAFWDVLYKGLDVCKEVPLRRWDVSTHVDPSGKARNKGATRWGCWLDFTAEFDPKFFSISPKEAPQMDPAQRMALMSTYEAMERGGIVPDTTPSTQRNRIGVFHGVTSNDWMETNTAQNIDTYFITGGNRGFIPGRINFCFEFSGPSFTNDTACSSSLAAIHLACNSLWRGDCDTAVAGGTNMIFTPDGHAGLDKGFFLSRTGNCKPFDDQADGYCRAEGVGTIFIKRLEDALADGDPILATILDTKTNHSAMSESMTRPHAGAQIGNMSSVLNTSCIHPNQLSYIEMHGTGTQVGDAIEMESVLTVFAPDETAREKDKPLYVGSAKANVGHGEGVSGVTSVIKVLLMMQHNTIVPHCGIKPGSKINHNYPDLGARNVHIAFQPKDWPRTKDPRRVLINNFSAAGGNTALLLEDAPDRSFSSKSDPRTSHIVTISGHVARSLKTNLERLLAHLQTKSSISLPQLSYTTTARRWHHAHRVSIIGSSIDEVRRKLETAINNGEGTSRPKSKPNVMFAFTGQGSQYLGMGSQLYEAYPSLRADLQGFEQLAQSHGFPSFLHVYTSSGGDIEEFLPVVVQLAITCLEMALGNLLRMFRIVPNVAIGHSLGEYAALYVASVLSASDTIYLVGKRAELLQERCQRGTHEMLATRATPATIQKLLSSSNCEVACINGPSDTILSGSAEDISDAQRLLTANGIKSTHLKLPFAFHSAQVQPILEYFETLARDASFEKPQFPILSPLRGNAIEDAGVISPAYLARHCREPVDFVKAIQFAKQKGIINDRTIIIEVGPKPLLCGMVKMTLGSQMTVLPTLTPHGDSWIHLQNIFSAIYAGGFDLNWIPYHGPFASAKRVIDLPTYGWDLKEYYIPYQGDWCLHRHKIECNCANAGGELMTAEYQVLDNHTPARKPSKHDATKEAYPEIQTTTTVHRVIEEKTEPLGAVLIVETDISRKDVNGIAQGHRVDDIPLCTPSFYADIAFQVGKYSMDRIRGGHPGAIDGLVDVTDLVVDKALIPHGQASQLLRTTLTMKWPPKAAATTRSAQVKFATYFADGKLDTEHATCTVRFTTNAQLKSLRKKVPEYQANIRRLRDGIMKGQFVKYNRKSGYKLMSSMADFHPDYKLLDNLVMDQDAIEATCMMDFSAANSTGTFAAHPAYVDAITQVGGFVLNASDSTDIHKEVFVNLGWESFQVYEPLVKNKTYEVYTKMHKGSVGDLVHGESIVLDGNNVVACFKGLSLRCVPRKALRAVLQSALDKGLRQRGGKKTVATSPGMNSKNTSPVVHPKSAAVQTRPVKTPVPAVQTKTTLAITKARNNPNPGDEKINEALKLISEESGIALDELTDDTNFIEMGIDSLSSMVIGSRLREDLGMDLSPDFSLFVDCATVQALKDFMGGSSESNTNLEDVVQEQASQPRPIEISANSPRAPIIEATLPFDPAAITKPLDLSMDSEGISAAIRIIAEESGVAIEELTGETVFAEIGIDSLSSMVISSRFREELRLDIGTGFSLFNDVPTVSKLEEFLSGGSSSSEDLSGSSDPESGSHSECEYAPRLNLQPYCRPTTSVILQGLPKVAKKTLFMLPDGGGSASSYASIPRLKSDVAIVGLNCPYARDAENMNCTHGAMIESFCNEIRRRQPKGPYYLGGWSSGGAFAYVTAEAFVNQGEEVHSLVIIDAPAPQVMEKLPASFYEHCNSVGLFANQPGGATDGKTAPPAFLIPHFVAIVDVMLDYKVAALKASRMPKVGIVWATDTVLEEDNAPKMKGMHFMVHKREDFGPDGWETILPGAEFDIVKAEGANRFTLMQKGHCQLISDLIDRVMT